MKLISSPQVLISKFPTPSYVAVGRSISQNILEGKDKRLAVLVGPCSIHDPRSALEFAARLKNLSSKIDKTLFPIMRFFVEKPRSQIGWKGLVYDPKLDGSNDIEKGLRLCRKLLAEIGGLEIACSTEFLDPLVSFYLSDLISWGVIGARTASSQPHRQMASGFSFPIGFKNDVHGNLKVAIDGIISARAPHAHLGIDPDGHISALQTKGNHWTHLILRGSDQGGNYDRESVNIAKHLLKNHWIEPKILIDCSHGNSGKEALNQKQPFISTIEQVLEGNTAIVGLLLESHLFEGKQFLGKNLSHLAYGVSITDSCLSWEETESLLLWADSCISSKSIHSVQK